jgi:hypothetical protein
VRRRGLILLYVVVSLIGGYLGGGLEAVPSWDAIALAIAQLCVAALVAMGALRVVDLLALRRQSHVRLERSKSIAADTRAVLESRFPGVGERAAKIDAASLLSSADKSRSSSG